MRSPADVEERRTPLDSVQVQLVPDGGAGLEVIRILEAFDENYQNITWLWAEWKCFC